MLLIFEMLVFDLRGLKDPEHCDINLFQKVSAVNPVRNIKRFNLLKTYCDLLLNYTDLQCFLVLFSNFIS